MVDLHGREVTPQYLAHGPVSGSATAVEQAGAGQQESAAADRRRAPGVLAGAAQPGHQRTVLGKAADDVRRAGYDQRVDGLGHGVIQALGGHHQAFGGWLQASVEAGGMQAVAGQAALGHGLGGCPEHGLRAAEVEQAHGGIGNEDHHPRLVDG
ncbi:hypothetical protein D3C73_1257150 [compost metagenome]